ncbi:TetR/AcrR family transcriptional regulator [Corallococcus sp. CA053C]|uniref:TetR/AcrR family transcriptional regulator n=1 Tax=Corallococcus sp. CA053C TaxID=2316732 RepID=UPI000EA27F71|nr:TetR/AcrR family transcriptional regulator [Corallococcus sp. CA053C]RKH13196.1 TetR/AcrR family transcriptional regulator [Corallococcus sp. CA053C]
MPRRPPPSRRRAPRQERAQATCDAILTATARILLKDGYEAASTNRIAQEAGVSVGSLYQYFPSKEGLVTALMERHRAQGLADFEAGLVPLASQPLPVAMRALIQQVISVKRENPKLNQVLHELKPRMRQWGLSDAYSQRLFRLVRAFLAPRFEELRPQNLDMAVFILVNTVEALSHSAVTERPDYLEDPLFVEELTALVLGYLRPEPATSAPRRTARERVARM